MACANPFDPIEGLRKQRARDELEAKITELWGHLNAATYRFLEFVAEFDREKGFARHGLVNTAQWLNWQCGIGRRRGAREGARRARARATARDRGRLREGRDLVLEGARDDARAPRRRTNRCSCTSPATARQRTSRSSCASIAGRSGATPQSSHRSSTSSATSRTSIDENGELILNARLAAGDRRRGSQGDRSGGRSAARAGRKCFRGNSTSAERPTAGARRADALRHIAETFLEHRGEETGAGSPATDRYQVVVHIDQAILAESAAAADDEPHCCELDDGPAFALDTARRCLRRDDRRPRRRRGRRAAQYRPQVPQHSAGDRASAPRSRRRLPVPGLRPHALQRRPSRQALGERRRDETREPRDALRLPPWARA